MANINIDDALYVRFRKCVSELHDGQIHGLIKREVEAAITNHMVMMKMR